MQHTPRPFYESDADRQAEAEIVKAVARNWELTSWRKLSPSYGADYAVTHGRHIALFVEAKNRRLGFGVGAGYYLALQKIIKLAGLAEATGLPVIVAVRFGDGVIREALLENVTPNLVILAGRNDRNDEADIEPHMVFQWRCFSEVGS